MKKYKSKTVEKRVDLSNLKKWENLDTIYFSFMCKIKDKYCKRSVKISMIQKFGINYRLVKTGRGRTAVLTGATKYLRGYMFIRTYDEHTYDNIDYMYFEKLTGLLKKVAQYKMIYRELVTATTKNGYIWKKYSRHYIVKLEKTARFKTIIKERKIKVKDGKN